ncbi:MAG: hypothetical protein GF372_03205 [Candidatus Marinimicrobia bacterium]|nr:hypothetical protein [Candidatus Neomarinimicrobiota bacterium]
MTPERPVFIFGAPRSGTSLLRRILNAHPEMGIPHESLIYSSLYDWRHHYGDFSVLENRQKLIRDILELKAIQKWDIVPAENRILEKYRSHTFHGAVSALITSWAEIHNKSQWGEKTPWHGFYWRAIHEGFPHARFVHLVRDGRDAALSWKRARFGPNHIYPLALSWADYLNEMNTLKKTVDKTHFHEIHYEELLQSPAQIIKKLCHFLDIDFLGDMLHYHTKELQSEQTDSRNERNLSMPILAKNYNKWKSQLSSREIRIFEAVSGDILARYGYKLRLKNPRISSWEKVLIKYFENPYKRLYSLIKNTAGYYEAFKLWKIRMRLIIAG